MTGVTLGEIDRDGAFCEAVAKVHGPTRAEFIRKAVVGGGALLAALAFPPREALARADDTSVLNFDLAFEYMQATFYTETERVGTVAKMTPEMAQWARVFGSHERAHVKIIKDVLGDAAVKKPAFNFRGVTEDANEFVKTAVAMEDLTTALLSGQTERISSRPLVSALFSLLTVEARHAAWVRHVVGSDPVVAAFDEPKSLREVSGVINDTNFFAEKPITEAAGAPRFTG
jgi:hypothetical protein